MRHQTPVLLGTIVLSSVLLALWRRDGVDAIPSPLDGGPWWAARRLCDAVGVPDAAFGLALASVVVVIWLTHDLARRLDPGAGWIVWVAPAFVAWSPPVALAPTTTPAICVFTVLLWVAARRTWEETLTPGAYSWSVLPWALICGFGVWGFALLGATGLQRLFYARRYQASGDHLRVIGVWALAAGVLGLLCAWGCRQLGSVPGGNNLHSGEAIGAWWRAERGLAIAPFLLFFSTVWKPRPIWYWAVWTAMVVAVWSAFLAMTGERRLWVLGMPMVPPIAVALGLAIGATRAALTAGGFQGRAATVATAAYLTLLATALAWPTLTRSAP